ncbi:TonB-dependent receptor [Hymenobacter qilianensis]|uniref:TonB-dependent receptor n=2 Tax=Hymenobacter qilianensis TaxID=1385715 RepID=A0A7H0GVT7_9BACT|nr:TonB-dependent receptor [Hymenobacter qilianensis]QNP52403.1 TonB-dependent receptor [Hymenobacter qilianensis]GGF67376.1 TonB-dependent receptor [Hymenobacter qilianensis]
MLLRYCQLLPLLLLLQLPSRAQTPDTARTVRLPEATVVGYGQNLPLRRTAAGVSVLDATVIDRFNQTSLTQAVNTLPGVRLEERATASYRLSVRGSTLRSPFGVRNVKLYYNDIPFTEASGSSPLNLLDPASIGRIEVIKGPAGSVYGAGTGGAILLNTRRPAPDEARVQAGFTAGSFGLRRYSVAAETGSAKASLRAQYTRQTLDGYRQNSALRRDVLTLDGEFAPSEQRTVSVSALYTDLDYQIPGSLTRAQFEQNPRQARPTVGTQLGTVDQRAGYASRTALLGVTHDYQFTSRWSNKTTLYASGTTIKTPFLVDLERNTSLGWGGRSVFGYRAALAGRLLRLSAGGEFQNSFENARNYQNRRGTPGPLRYDDEISTSVGFGFAQADWELPANFLLTAGASLNGLRYRIARVSDAAARPDSFAFRRNFQPVVSPRVALLKEITSQISAYASVSSGFSPPSEEEIRPSDGSLNRNLEAERGSSYELGTRGNLFNNRLVFDVALFDFRLKQTIVTRTTDAGVNVFFNSGSTRQRGVEAAVSGWLLRPVLGSLARGTFTPSANILPNSLRAWASYAYNHFRFRDYQQGDQDYSGNRLTGTAPHTLSAGLDFNQKLGFYLQPTLSHQARIPLNDANTVYAAGYWTFATRAGWRRVLGGKLEADIFAGLENATDRRYSLGNDLNAFGQRYFQPAPGRNWYSGVQLGWRW